MNHSNFASFFVDNVLYNKLKDSTNLDFLKNNNNLDYVFKGKVIFYNKVNNDYKLLFGKEMQNNNNFSKFNTIGGTKNLNETIFECIVREVYEETLCIINKDKLMEKINKNNNNIIIFEQYKYKNKIKVIVKTILLFIEWDSSLFGNSKHIPLKFDFRKKVLNNIMNIKGPLSDNSKKLIKRFIFKSDINFSKKKMKDFNELDKIVWLDINSINDRVINSFLFKNIKYTLLHL